LNVAAPVRVVLVDDQELVRTGFRLVLRRAPDVEVVGEAGDGVAAIELLRTVDVDVVIMDVRMPRMGGVEATRRIRSDTAAAGRERPRVLILTTFDLDEYAFAAIKAGASGFLLKDVGPDHLIEAVHTVHRGNAVVAPTTTRRLLDRFARHLPSGPTPHTALTPREQEVLTEVAAGLSNAEVAARLFVSEGTVRTHVSHILVKLGLRDRVQVVVYAYENGLAGLRP
jgi:DNA-binding NarL/FixJ family response regulator